MMALLLAWKLMGDDRYPPSHLRPFPRQLATHGLIVHLHVYIRFSVHTYIPYCCMKFQRRLTLILENALSEFVRRFFNSVQVQAANAASTLFLCYSEAMERKPADITYLGSNKKEPLGSRHS